MTGSPATSPPRLWKSPARQWGVPVKGTVRVVCNWRAAIGSTSHSASRATGDAPAVAGAGLPGDSPPLQGRAGAAVAAGARRASSKAVPTEPVSLIAGKAHAVTQRMAAASAFSAAPDDSRSAWALNYELVWVDESGDGVRWVQEEFDALWHCTDAVDLADAVIEEIGRLLHRTRHGLCERVGRRRPG